MIKITSRTLDDGEELFYIKGMIRGQVIGMYRPGIEELQREISNALTSLDKTDR